MAEAAGASGEAVRSFPDGLKLGIYRSEESDEALALDRLCTQGASYRLSFRRPTFHRRAEAYDEWRIVTARLDGSLVGLAAAAIKRVECRGEETVAAFYFDLRVHPAFRGRAVGRRLGAEIRGWARARSALGYTYGMAGNRSAGGLLRLAGAVDVGGFAYLVYPVYRQRSPAPDVAAAAFEEVHQAMKQVAGPFDLYARPTVGGRESGYVGSWLLRRGPELAGCSAWCHAGVLAEVVEAVPTAIRLAKRLTATWPLRLARWPHFPSPGERLRSWYLFDWFSTDPALARVLMRHVAAQAGERGVDYCHVVHGSRDRWIRQLRSDVLHIFAPVLTYRLWAELPERLSGPLDHVYVDVHDL